MEWWENIQPWLMGLVLISNSLIALKTIRAPAKKWRERIETLETDYEEISKQLSSVEKKLEEQKSTNRALLSGIISIINHQIDGNGIDGLKTAREELLQHIIKK